MSNKLFMMDVENCFSQLISTQSKADANTYYKEMINLFGYLEMTRQYSALNHFNRQLSEYMDGILEKLDEKVFVESLKFLEVDYRLLCLVLQSEFSERAKAFAINEFFSSSIQVEKLCDNQGAYRLFDALKSKTSPSSGLFYDLVGVMMAATLDLTKSAAQRNNYFSMRAAVNGVRVVSQLIDIASKTPGLTCALLPFEQEIVNSPYARHIGVEGGELPISIAVSLRRDAPHLAMLIAENTMNSFSDDLFIIKRNFGLPVTNDVVELGALKTNINESILRYVLEYGPGELNLSALNVKIKESDVNYTLRKLSEGIGLEFADEIGSFVFSKCALNNDLFMLKFSEFIHITGLSPNDFADIFEEKIESSQSFSDFMGMMMFITYQGIEVSAEVERPNIRIDSSGMIRILSEAKENPALEENILKVMPLSFWAEQMRLYWKGNARDIDKVIAHVPEHWFTEDRVLRDLKLRNELTL